MPKSIEKISFIYYHSKYKIYIFGSVLRLNT